MKLSIPYGVEIEVAELDDPPRLRVVAADGLFAGEIELWGSADAVEELAAAVAGFPSGVGDSREFTLGSFDPRFAGGAAQFRFHADGAARTSVRIELEDAFRMRRLVLHIRVEAAGIDRFVTQLHALTDAMQREELRSAMLEGAS